MGLEYETGYFGGFFFVDRTGLDWDARDGQNVFRVGLELKLFELSHKLGQFTSSLGTMEWVQSNLCLGKVVGGCEKTRRTRIRSDQGRKRKMKPQQRPI